MVVVGKVEYSKFTWRPSSSSSFFSTIISRSFLWFRCWGFLFLFLFLLLFSTARNEKSNHNLRFNVTIIVNLEFIEDIINLSLVENITEMSQSMSEHFGFNGFLAILFLDHLISLKCADNEVIRIISSTSHLLLEHFDHGVEGA